MSATLHPYRFVFSIAVFAITLSIGLCFVGLSQSNRLYESSLERQQVLAQIRSEIEYQLASTVASTEILAHEVLRSRGEVQNFDGIAQGILDQISGIDNLQLAPEGIVRKIYPLRDNLEALGHAILGDKRRNADAYAAVESGKLTLAGPLTLVQGGVAVIARKPVYLWEEGARKVKSSLYDGKPPFWGFVSALIKLEDILNSPTLRSLSDLGLSYEFTRFDPNKNLNIRFAESGDLLASSSDKIDIMVPNGKWTLAIGTDRAVGVFSSAIELALILFFSLLFAVLTARLLAGRTASAFNIGKR